MPQRLNFTTDNYSLEDQLGFKRLTDTLAAMIREENFATPFCIGIDGDWGTGKTSFMRQLEDRLKNDGPNKPVPVPVWFNPWRYQKEEHLIIPFLKTMEKSLADLPEELVETGGEILKNAAVKMGDVASALAYGLKADFKLGPVGVKFDTAKAVEREIALEQERSEARQKLSDHLTSVYYDVLKELQGAVDEKEFRIVAFIDDLDRCLPERAVDLLEAIKTFLDLKGYLFIIGVSQEVVEKGIRHRYHYLKADDTKPGSGAELIKPEDYLEKIIQMPLKLPPIESGRKLDYIKSLLGEADSFKKPEVVELISSCVGHNPRAVKRYVNLLAFTARLAETVKNGILTDDGSEVRIPKGIDLATYRQDVEKNFMPLQYVKWTLFSYCYPTEYQSIKGNWGRLLELQEAALKSPEEQKGEAGDLQDLKETSKSGLSLPKELRAILTAGIPFPEKKWLIDMFINLCESSLVSEDGGSDKAVHEKIPIGSMRKISCGEFLYGEKKEPMDIDYDYEISAYPVTNRQFCEFMNSAFGNGKPLIVEDKKLLDFDRSKINLDGTKFSIEEGYELHPTTGVSWHGAEAFCDWRTEREDGEIRLPTEQEWEKAARGERGYIYPWGDEFNPELCNSIEAGIGGTTPVTKYTGGRSPYGCYDMGGNVWEWTDSWNDGDKDYMTVRGGSWTTDMERVRCANRHISSTDDWSLFIGFRCARTLKGLGSEHAKPIIRAGSDQAK